MVKYYFALLLISFLLISCSSSDLEITGDLSSPNYVSGNTNLVEWISDNGIEAEYALLCGKDGTAAYIHKKAFTSLELVKTGGKWNSETTTLPEVCNIKDLSRISLFTRDPEHELFFLKATGQIEMITPFEAELNQYELLGKSRKNGHSVRKYKFVQPFQLSVEADSILAISENGREFWIKPDEQNKLAEIKFSGCHFSFQDNIITSIWQDPPVDDAVSLHNEIRDSVKDSRALFIFIDSYGWHYNEHLLALHHKGFLTDQQYEPLRVPYPPRTVNSYWTIGSGEFWQNRKNDDEYFSGMLREDQYGVIIEADRIYYPSQLEQIMHTDINNDGTIDDEIFAAAMEYMSNEPDLMLVHFHSVDDEGHNSGAYSQPRLDAFNKVEEYTEQLTGSWDGKVYIFSDHGMHTEGDSGIHNSASAEDILGLWGRIK